MSLAHLEQCADNIHKKQELYCRLLMGYIDINNSRICYTRIDGHPDNPCLVFLHEGLGCIEMWKEFPDHLCRRTGCPGLIYDRHGYGKSSPLTRTRDIDYVHEYARTELNLLIDTILGNQPCILVGHSDGASIALIYGAAHRPHLKAIVSEAAHVFVEDKTIAGIEIAHRHYLENGVPGLVKYHGHKTDIIFKAWAEIWLNDWFRSWNIEALLPEITCPVLAFQGAEDAYGTVKQVESIVSNVTGPAEPFIIEGCGHTPHLEREDMVLTTIQNFIKRYIS